MSHVAEQHGAALVRDGPEPGVIPIPRVRAPSADDELGAKIHGLLLQPGVVDVPGVGAHLVRQALKVDGRGRDLLAAGRVVPVGEVPPGRQVEPHDPVVGLEQPCVGREVRRRARVWLHVDAPGGGVEVERGERARAAELLDLVDDLVAAVVARPRHALRVLVGERGAERLHDGERGEVLGGDELDARALPPLLALDEVVHLRVGLRQRSQPPLRHGVHCVHCCGGGGGGGNRCGGGETGSSRRGAEEREAERGGGSGRMLRESPGGGGGGVGAKGGARRWLGEAVRGHGGHAREVLGAMPPRMAAAAAARVGEE
uniref:Uncharacterized protein n=1 Tax=Arundo donax TaxID=35708 RepID=A0A0A8Y5G5_ARUDO